MNFLGHLFFSNNDKELMYANLFGDFVKGKALYQFPELIQRGIILHRSIDDYIDRHRIVRNLLKILYPELPKVSNVAVDLFFDHLLAQQWKKYHAKEITLFLDEFYSFQPELWNNYPKEFTDFIHQMRDGKWLNYYAIREGLEKACIGVASRISFSNKLQYAPLTFDRYYSEINQCFEIFMNDAIRHFETNK